MADVTNATADEANRLSEEGRVLLESRRFDEARASLTRARQLAPDDPLIHYRMGILFSDTGRPRDALMCFDTAIRLNPDEVRAHNNRGSALQIMGRMAEAEIAFKRAIALAPDVDVPHLNLGQLLEQTGRKHEAVALYRQAIDRGLNPPLFEHHLAAIEGQSTNRAPDDWVVATFDNFAPTFDTHLRGLGYMVPQRLANLLQARSGGPWDILDLGCGTGLCGEALASRKRSLVGVDLSERMLAQAEARKVYDEVTTAEVHAWLDRSDPASFDVVCAADVLIYIGALEGLFALIARVLRSGGYFAFSTEECVDQDFRLLPTGRYAQSEAYIRRLSSSAFDVHTAEATVIRFESGAAIPGRLYLLERR